MMYHRQICVELYSYGTVVLLLQYILKCFELHVGVVRDLSMPNF